MKTLNLGCGLKPWGGAVNVDILSLPGVQIVHDLAVTPWPIEGEFDEIFAYDVIEHLAPIRSRVYIEFVEECHRLLKPGGVLTIRTCGMGDDFTRDPSHFKCFHKDSFRYFVPGNFWSDNYGFYSPVRFEEISVEEINNGWILEFKLRKI
jgi:SAM-dependent methyltransferase